MKARWLSCVLCVAALACGSGSYTLWRGKTVDRRSEVRVVETAGRQKVLIGGVEGGSFDAVASSSLTFSSDGRHVAYAARRNGAWLVVHDRSTGSGWDAIGEMVLTPHGEGLAYFAERAGRWHVVRGEQSGPSFDALLRTTLRLSDDARHLAYVASEGGKVRLVRDDQIGPAFDGIGMLRSTRDGAHVAYAARRGATAFVVFDGAISEPWVSVGEVVLGEHGRIAYAARKVDGADALVVDGESQSVPYSSVVAKSLAFRPGTEALAFVGQKAAGDVRVVVGDFVSAGFDSMEENRVVFSSDGRRFGYTGRRGSGFVVTLNGVEQSIESWASLPAFSADGTRAGYLVRRGRRMAIVVDGKSREVDVAIDRTMAFSSDSRHWACLAGSTAERKFFFLVDGQPSSTLDFEELVSAARGISLDEAMRGRGDEILHGWAAAEAELASAR